MIVVTFDTTLDDYHGWSFKRASFSSLSHARIVSKLFIVYSAVVHNVQRQTAMTTTKATIAVATIFSSKIMTQYNEIHILFVEFIILLVFVYYCSRTQARTHVYIVYMTKRSFWQVRCQTIKALELHTIFALIASIYSYSYVMLSKFVWIYFISFYSEFMRKIQRNKHSYMVCIQNNDAQNKKEEETGSKTGRCCHRLKLIWFFLQTHTRTLINGKRARETGAAVNKSLWPLFPQTNFLFSIFF